MSTRAIADQAEKALNAIGIAAVAVDQRVADGAETALVALAKAGSL
jgi:hypothetical protein